MNLTPWYTHRPIAHRGLFNEGSIPENSLLAFKEAMIKGRPIEIDVRLTKDEEIVVFHDETLERVTGSSGLVSKKTLDELKKLNLGNTSEAIPTLKETLNFVNGEVPILIELKVREFDGRLEELIRKVIIGYHGEIAIQSFNPLSIHWLRKNIPDLKLGILAGNLDEFRLPFWKKQVIRNLVSVPFVQPDFVSVESSDLNRISLRLIKKFGDIPVIAWTIKSQKDYQKIKGLCSNIIYEGFNPV